MDKPFYTTPLKEDFVVTDFISVHFGQLYNREYPSVCYDFWQVIYIHEGTWNVSIGERNMPWTQAAFCLIRPVPKDATS